MNFLKPSALFLSVSVIALSASTLVAQAQIMHNDRFKLNHLPTKPIENVERNRGLSVSGVWEPESKAAGKALVFPIQVQIHCSTRRLSDRQQVCHVYSVAFGMMPQAVSVQSIDEDDFDVSSWTESGLTAKNEGTCQDSVLSISFKTGAVLLSDIPNHQDGCGALTEANTYRLARGEYYVDTTPGNDLDKQGAKK
jgi:hypothetical protein